MHRQLFTLLAAAAAVVLMAWPAMAAPSAAPPPPIPCRCPHPTCVLCQSVGDADFLALARESGTEGPAPEAPAPYAEPVDTPPQPLPIPCRCPKPGCSLCQSGDDLDIPAPRRESGVEGVVLPHEIGCSLDQVVEQAR